MLSSEKETLLIKVSGSVVAFFKSVYRDFWGDKLSCKRHKDDGLLYNSF